MSEQNAKSETPRTDAEADIPKPQTASFTMWAARGWDFARTLERELSTALKERDEAREEIEQAKVKAFNDGKAAQAIMEVRARDSFIADKRKELNQDRDQWKKLAEKLKGFVTHLADCEQQGIVGAHGNNCYCGLTETLKSMEGMKWTKNLNRVRFVAQSSYVALQE